MDYKEFRDDENEKINYALEDHLDIDYDILIERRWDVAQDWDTSKVPARKSIQETIEKIEDRVENIFLELYKNKFQLSNKMKNFTRYNYSDGLKGSILYTDNQSSTTTESLREINSIPLTYKKVEQLLINLKDNNYNLTVKDKLIKKHKSFKSQRSKFIKNNRMDKKYESALQAIFSYDKKRLPLNAFLQLIDSPSKYYNRVLVNSFIKYCNNENGKLYKKCKGYKIVEYKQARNVETGEIEKHIGLVQRDIK